MQMNKQRKLLITVAGVGLSALALDKLVLGPPESASAGQAVAETPAFGLEAAPDEPSPPAAGAVVEQEKDGLSTFGALTERLINSAKVQVSADRVDPFSLPEGWGSTASQPLAEAQQVQQQTPSTQLLLEQYQLDGTFSSVIDDKVVQLGVITGGIYTGQSMRVGQEIRVDLGAHPVTGSAIYETYRLLKVGTRAVLWQSTADDDRQVVMRAPEVLKSP